MFSLFLWSKETPKLSKKIFGKMKKLNLFQLLTYCNQQTIEILGPKKGAEHCTKLTSVVLGRVVPALGGPIPSGNRMTEEERQKAYDFLASLPVERIYDVLEALEDALKESKLSKGSCRVYLSVVKKWVGVSIQNFLEPEQSKAKTPCCPKMYRGRGGHNQPKLTNRVGRYQKYAREWIEMPIPLQEFWAKLERYSLEPYYPGRVKKQLSPNTFEAYEQDLRMIVTFKSLDASLAVPMEQLGIQDVCPHLIEEEFKQLSRDEQYQRHKQHADHVEQLILEFFACRAATVGPLSPATRANYITVMLWVFYFLYCKQVRSKADYAQFPVVQMLKHLLSVVMEEKKEWKLRGRELSDKSQKYPDLQEGQTQLDWFRSEIVEPLRQECCPLSSWGYFRQSHGVAVSLQRFIILFLLAFLPSRRQQEFRSLKLVHSCLLSQRPKFLPDKGCIFPMPPPEQRDKDAQGFPCDNFLIYVYEFEGKVYEGGSWLMVIDSYKTVCSLGSVTLEIPNIYFDDGMHFYDYLDQFLFGIWTARMVKEAQFYQGDDESLKGQKGVWATRGRNEFLARRETTPEDDLAEPRNWDYVFLKPRKGTRYDNETGFGKFFQAGAFRLTGKQLTPHDLRHFWANWAYHNGLSEQEIEALAYAMGHSVKTLKTVYQRLSSSERLKPIAKVLKRFHKSQGESDELCLDDLKQTLLKLSPDQLVELQEFLEGLDDEAA